MEIALIVAGGKGQRMRLPVPKQFHIISGLPVLMHTINAFRKYNPSLPIILVLPGEKMDEWNELVKKYDYENVQHLVEGSHSRYNSVYNGLKKVKADDIVAVHDGVRPMVTPAIIERTFKAAEIYGSAVTCVKLKDSVRKISQSNSFSQNRSEYVLVQTPQTFSGNIIKNAYIKGEMAEFTDDASVVEKSGHSIHLVDGDFRNIKITTNEDIALAEFYLNQKRS